MSIIEGWTAKLEKYVREKMGLLSIKVGDFTYQAYFDTSVLRVNGEKCSERGHLHSYAKLGDVLHLNAEKLKKPRYDLGVNVWYRAVLVWSGQKPSEAELSDDSSEYESIVPDEPEVYGQFGAVVKIINKNTAVVKSYINGYKKPSLVAVERCRLHINGNACSKQISKDIKLGDIIHFEAFQIHPKHPSGVEYQASFAWTVFRPDLELKKPVHPLHLPSEPLFPPPIPNATSSSAAGPSSAPGAIKKTLEKGTNTEAENIDQAAEAGSSSKIVGLLGLVVALPNSSTAVLKSEIDSKPALIALERCRFYIHNRACPQDIRTVISLGAGVRFEAFHIGQALPNGVEFRVSLAWLGNRPELNLPQPSHNLDLPHELSINLLAALHAYILK